ncbi:MAG: N-acetylmuramoyl-L-alanine amidase [Candidatus Eiseniibacteriota bacterium]
MPASTSKLLPARLASPGMAAASVMAAWLAAAVPAGAVDLLAVRHWSAPDHTRIVIDLSARASFLHFALEDPPRIAVEVEGGRFRLPSTQVAVGDGLVRQVRFNLLAQSGKAQVVVDLESSTRYDVFALEKIEAKPHRIVIDVKRPPAAAAPESLSRRPAAPRDGRVVGPSEFGDFLIMIDPGHGGEDAGRRNPDGTTEKRLALELSKAVAAEINARAGYRAELTRKGDYFVSLGRRREIAEQRGAHLFVSVHFNAAPSSAARGTEVFFVSLSGADSRATRELEEAENSADLVGGVPPADAATQSSLTRMLVDLRQNDSVERSQRLATEITDHVDRIRGVQTRRVKQAGFAVLKSLFIPAVLVEAGFLTNRDDLRFFLSETNRARYAKEMADAIVDYCEDVEVPRLGWKIHTVDTGETLSNIATAYAMDIEDLRGVNALVTDRIVPGQKLRVRPR